MFHEQTVSECYAKVCPITVWEERKRFKVILNGIFFPLAVSVMRYSASSFGFAVSRDTI